MEVQQRVGLKNVLLEKKQEVLTDKLEKQSAYLNELLAEHATDPSTLVQVQQRVEELVDAKNAHGKRLQYELSKTAKAHNDMLRTFLARLRDYNIPIDDLGFKPLVIDGLQLGQGPSALVVDKGFA